MGSKLGQTFSQAIIECFSHGTHTDAWQDVTRHPADGLALSQAEFSARLAESGQP